MRTWGPRDVRQRAARTGAPAHTRLGRYDGESRGAVTRGAGIPVSSELPLASSGAPKFVCGLLNASKHVFNG